MSIVFSRFASKKSHMCIRPFSEPVISWKALCGLRIAHVSRSDEVSSEVDRGADSVETTCPVATE